MAVPERRAVAAAAARKEEIGASREVAVTDLWTALLSSFIELAVLRFASSSSFVLSRSSFPTP